MGDAPNGAPQHHGYFQQYLSRMAPTPLPPPPMPLPASSTRPSVLLRGAKKQIETSTNAKSKGKDAAKKSLVDAFKQHGMKLCDGSKLNAVAKGVTHIGAIPPTLGMHITALYLSQNRLRALDGIEQFQNVRLLSIAANLVARFADVERLKQLPQLRHLSLMGNPLCDYPNYRFRVVDAMPQLAVLDTIEISKDEREIAVLVASQDRALCGMVLKNHMEIQKLRRLGEWITVLGELQCMVLRDAVTGRYDKLPSPQAASSLNIERFLRLWPYEDMLTARERETLEAQMMAVIARTRSRLVEDTPQSKAKELLFKLANMSAATSGRRQKLSSMPMEVRREHGGWEDAYAQVLQLQQQTIANLRGECDRNRQAMAQSLRQLVVVNPFQRREQAVHRERSPRQNLPAEPKRQVITASVHDHGLDCPQDSQASHDSASVNKNSGSNARPVQTRKRHEMLSHKQGETGKETRPSSQAILRRGLRAGEFGNKTLHEAVHGFKLRQPFVANQNASKPIGQTRRTILQAHSSTLVPPNGQDDVIMHLVSPQHASSLYSGGLDATNCASPDRDDLESCGKTWSETAHGTDVLSLGGMSADYQSEFEQTVASPFITASNAKLTRPRDEVVRESVMCPKHLTTVDEEDTVADKETSMVVDDEPSRRDNDIYGQRTHFMSERQHELEDREEKYISALMESEQRELDLRQQINLMSKQISRFQQTATENEQERLKIKAEIHERVHAVARPTLLRRFFVKWIKFRRWTLHFHHFQRRRQFVDLHDAFWCWRRQVWAQQQLARIRKRHQARLLRCHLTDWANLTRISVIAVHTQALHQSQLLKRVVNEWRQRVHVERLTRRIGATTYENLMLRTLATALSGWRKVTARSRLTRRLHQFYSRFAKAYVKRLVLTNWKIYILSIARPLRAKVHDTMVAVQWKAKRRYFCAWKALARCDRLRRHNLRRKVWAAWRGLTERDLFERKRVASFRVEFLKLHLTAWQRAAADQGASRRSMNLAMRHVNHRRLRKLWMYWKIYSIARKRYMQGAKKAMKHFFKKLLRRTWAQWKHETRKNLVSVKNRKQGERSFHFKAFREGVQKLQREKRRLLFAHHALRRRQVSQLRHTFTSWMRCSKCRARCKILHQVIQNQRSNNLVGFMWSRWKHERLVNLQRQLEQKNHAVHAAKIEQKELEAEVTVIRDRSIDLCENVRSLNLQVSDQANDIKSYQSELLQRERKVVALENELDEMKKRVLQDSGHQGEIQRKMERDNASQRNQLGYLEKENVQLKSKILELETQVESICRTATTTSEEKTSVEALLKSVHAQKEELWQGSQEREQTLRATIADLQIRLEQEQREREETVHRLQEYETRIASTCSDIQDHEQAHEQECLNLRAENARVGILWKEETVRSAELQCLLNEKNEQIIALSVQLKNSQWNNDKASQQHCHRAKQHHGNDNPEQGDNTVNDDTEKLKVVDVPDQSLRTIHAQSSNGNSGDALLNCMLVVKHESRQVDAETDGRGSIDFSDRESPLEPMPLVASEEERQIDERTSRIHADLQLLQERISKRLQQIPCVPSVGDLILRRKDLGKQLAFDSNCESVSTLSESDRSRDRKSTRRPSTAKPRSSSVVSAGFKTSQRKPASGGSDRENNSRNWNRLNPQVDVMGRQPLRSREPCITRRPSVAATETLKRKKCMSKASTIKKIVGSKDVAMQRNGQKWPN